MYIFTLTLIKQDLTIYSPRAHRLFKMFEPTAPTQSIADVILQKKGISADHINQVIFRYNETGTVYIMQVTSIGITAIHSHPTCLMQQRSLDRHQSRAPNQDGLQPPIPHTFPNSWIQVTHGTRM
jgi:hypothetical protein